MATQTNNFTRSNVNAATLQITDPGRSTFNLGHKNELTIPFGKIVPVSTKILLPTDTFTGSLRPNFHLEKIGTPSIGATRLDTHTFVVNFRRINKDMRANLEKGVNFFPTVSLDSILNYYLGHLLCGEKQKPTVSDYIKSVLSTATSFYDLSYKLAETACLSIDEFIVNYDKVGEMYYQKDKYLQLYHYYYSLFSDLQSTNFGHNDPKLFFQFFMPAYFKPFIGPSSLLDYLGYICYSPYSKISAQLENDSLDIDREQFFSLFKASFNSNFLFQIIFNGLSYRHEGSTATINFVTSSINTVFSELPLRAYYAVWYDYIRNWHIEERQYIIDPDNFSNKSVIVPNITGSSVTDFLQTISKFLSFYTLRSRDYGTDFLTSIQTDDAFRHVFNPVFSVDSVGNQYKGSIITQGLGTAPSTVDALTIQEFGMFGLPSDSKGTNNPVTFDFAQDLQTMRRCGMLERWLARNYYYPDTYVGRLQARFGVRPSDYEVLVSQYIGGSESFISGQELVANMSTPETVVGSRNLKADVSTTDKFSGSVSDYSILVSVVSTVPITTYDVVSPAAKITDFIDFPQPEFATDTRVEARTSDFLRGFSISPFIGYVPRYYMFRVSADETHGRYLTDYRTFNWLRDSYSMSQEAFDFSLNPYSLRVNLPLNAFIGLRPWDDFAYGSCDVNLVVNRALPAAIEII